MLRIADLLFAQSSTGQERGSFHIWPHGTVPPAWCATVPHPSNDAPPLYLLIGAASTLSPFLPFFPGLATPPPRQLAPCTQNLSVCSTNHQQQPGYKG